MNTKEKILISLQDKSVVEVLAKRYTEAEKELEKELSKLKNWQNPCNCKGDIDIVRTIFEGEYPEISTYCLKCGGYIEEHNN